MPTVNQVIRTSENPFEQKVRQALTNIKNGSITVIKQDNLIIQVNISENLGWNYTPPAKQAVCTHPKPASL